jgi:hypothetical protein
MKDGPGSPGFRKWAMRWIRNIVSRWWTTRSMGPHRTAGAMISQTTRSADLSKALFVTQHGHERALRVCESGEVGCAVGVMLRS